MKKRYITRTIFQNELEIVEVNLDTMVVRTINEIVPMEVKDLASATEYLEYPDYIKIVKVRVRSEIVNKYKITETDFMKYATLVDEQYD